MSRRSGGNAVTTLILQSDVASLKEMPLKSVDLNPSESADIVFNREKRRVEQSETRLDLDGN